MSGSEVRTIVSDCCGVKIVGGKCSNCGEACKQAFLAGYPKQIDTLQQYEEPEL